MEIREFFGFGPSKTVAENRKLVEESAGIKEGALHYVQEGMMAALSMALEQGQWLAADGFDRADGAHLTFAAIQSAAKNGRALVTGNPIMHRAALAQTAYVWGDGCRITGADDIIKKRQNKRNIFGRAAVLELEMSKIADGNVLIFIEGHQLSTIPFYEIKGGVYEPSDPSFIRYFYREWTESITDFTTMSERKVDRKMLYPNMDYERGGVPHPEQIGGVQVNQDGVIRHVAPNRLKGDAWGLPDLIAGIFYAGEHKELVEAADAIFRAQSQYAVQYKAKTRQALDQVAASIAGPPPIDPSTGEALQYGQTVAYGSDVEMQLMNKIGAGIDFDHFDPIAGLASVVLAVPLDVVLGAEPRDTAVPVTTKRTMRSHQLLWDEVFHDIFEYIGKRNAKTYWPKIDPDPTHRQVQSIAGIAALKVASPEEVRELARDTFGADWKAEVPDPAEWEPFAIKTTAPGSTEPAGGTVTPGQGQTGQLGKLADGDHSLRDEGQQAHTQK